MPVNTPANPASSLIDEPVRGTGVPPFEKWRALRFELRYRDRKREVTVLAPFPEYAVLGTGATSDEEVIPSPSGPIDEAFFRMTTPKRANGAELVNFFQEFQRCMVAGITELRTLEIIAPMCKTPYFRGVISGLRYLMSAKGFKLSFAMEAFPGAFDDIAINMVRAGETTGKQEVTFKRIGDRLQSSHALMGKFYGAMVQPGITLGFLVVSLLIMHFNVFPLMIENFKALRMTGDKLPMPTRIALGGSEYLHQHPIIWMIPIVFVATIVLNWRKILKSEAWQKFAVRAPIIGRAYRLLILARSLDALALLNEAGVPFQKCYALAARIAGHFEYSAFYLEVYRGIAAGNKPHSAFLKERWRIGPEGQELASRVEASSHTGEMSESLHKTSVIMQEIADATLETLPKLLNPATTVFATVVIGNLAMAIILPNFQLLFEALKSGAH